MKTRIIKSILVLLLVFVAMPMKAQDYLKICFKDGHTERHFMQLVENISVTKYDLEGNQHSDYQMQQIVMADTTYSYYLSDIESMSFTKVDEEQVKNRVESAESAIEQIIQQCSSAEEFASHADDIKNIDGVEEVWSNETEIMVQMRDWYRIIYVYPFNSQFEDSFLSKMHKAVKNMNVKLNVPPKREGPLSKVALAFQMVDDVGFDEHQEVLEKLKHNFELMGFDANFIPNDNEIVDRDFFERRMFDYDIVVLDTHGGRLGGTHYFYTSEKPDWWNIQYYGLFDMDGVCIWTCHTGINEENTEKFLAVSEDFIKNSQYGFKGTGPHVVFSGACKTLKGSDQLRSEHNGVTNTYKGSDAVAKIFFDKGADIFLGYNHYAVYSTTGACDFFNNMLSGYSEEAAYCRLAPKLKKEDSQYQAELIDLFNPNSPIKELKSQSFFSTETVEKSEQAFNDEYKANGSVEFLGKTLCRFPGIADGITYGFIVATEPNVISTENTWNEGEITFSAKFVPTPGNTYFYRAYTYDGIHYNKGEERHFKIEATKKLIKVEPTEIDFGEVEVGSSKSATFTVSNVGTASLTVTVASGLDEGDDCVLPGSGQQFTLAVGQSKTFTVTYSPTKENSGFNAIVRILSDAENDTQIVTISGRSYKASGGDVPSYTSCPDDHHPHLIDLGLPSGTKWACCNVGASAPERYGSYFAWGETTEKSSYTEENYLDGKGIRYDIGTDIAGTQYDAATANWGSPWVMPNLEQMEELKNSCTSEWTIDGRRFTGPNGASIFLPAAGYRWGGYWSDHGSNGRYWSSSLNESRTNDAWYLYFSSGTVSTAGLERDYGRSVRPVRKN